jgi:hypothetical protein
MWEKCAVLKNQADFSFLDIFVGNIFSVEKYSAGVRADKTSYGLEQYAFTHTGSP